MFTAVKKDGTHTIVIRRTSPISDIWKRRDNFNIPHSHEDHEAYEILTPTTLIKHTNILDELAQNPDWFVTQHNPQENTHEPSADPTRN